MLFIIFFLLLISCILTSCHYLRVQNYIKFSKQTSFLPNFCKNTSNLLYHQFVSHTKSLFHVKKHSPLVLLIRGDITRMTTVMEMAGVLATIRTTDTFRVIVANPRLHASS